ncbi:Alpha-ketoglutarate-dependent dioxygenase alkB 7, mitochondrial [Modicella reniformis]|uniref:Alpha-ketoglutarate-dependent dioxygenase alkB 7, mitochondrial n=1 Tax=Modicella reniformis TaxID=1440133 RepID=A0A9P6MI53_9FUNG|nr:Alpha-ketoglutarate-dependent dioxygenase alkB 7, mitochondrial [Modicella reniformis]
MNITGVACLRSTIRTIRSRVAAPSELIISGTSIARPRSFTTAIRCVNKSFSGQQPSPDRAISQQSKALYTTSSTTSSLVGQNTLVVYRDVYTPPSIAATHFDLSRINPSEHAQILSDFIIVPEYLSSLEHDMLVEAATKKLKRALGKQVRFEDGHFDGVITRYRECSATDWGAGPDSEAAAAAAEASSSSPSSSSDTPTAMSRSRAERTTPREIIYSIKQEFFPHHWKWVAPHILELEAGKGGIKPHVDHLEASGAVVAGLCLGSTAVMELIHEDDPDKLFRVLLPKRCFYFQRDSVRYRYKHGIPILPEDHQFKGSVIPKEKRISIMLRNALESSQAASAHGSSM